MSDNPDDHDSKKTPPREEGRTFLCVVDNTEELSQALRFACRRAVRSGGRVALLYVIEPVEFQHWMAVGNLMREERREEAEEMINVVASVVQKRTGSTPVIFIREGNLTDELIKLIDEEKEISVLVLGAATGAEGPGPIISYLVGKMAGRLRIPITIVPGSLTDEQIDAIT
ncbi:MAG: universal stress protein [Rhodospirillales bacterium RIFCSPLOWO2_12_FULL_58_28]|nr:MAG: universal stress protein [Rhodospirillales bacterium RIFCSPLOWO2_02_FULL_58_16]OHC77166.1 MAG: universal stress protein [Rhodospirillales bacterium RIFCSPLOWO2_12_FULL_58_28]